MACSAPFHPDALYAEVTRAGPYSALPRRDFDDVVGFVEDGGYALAAYDRFRRLFRDAEGMLHIRGQAAARQLRMNLGTIVETPMLKVRLRGGGVVGEVEEWFVSTLEPGDCFLFGGQVLRYERLDPAAVIVSRGGEVSDPFSVTVAALAPAPNLARTIPSPATIAAGPTRVTFPRRMSLRSLKRSKCVRVVVRSTRPARVLVTIFSGNRSIRLFGQKRVVFRSKGRKVVCIRVPARAKTFDVRTPLRFAVGWKAGARARVGESSPKPKIRDIVLVP
jgi:hypothetical protein